MLRVHAQAMANELKFQSPVDLTHLRFEWGELAITLISGGEKKAVVAKFEEVIGFRFLDEGDLLEFWPVCASDNGWLFQVSNNGWFDLELSRPGFLRDKKIGIFEYFIASQGGCVSILSGAPPSIEILSI